VRNLFGLLSAVAWLITAIAVIQAFNGAPWWVVVACGALALVLGWMRNLTGPGTALQLAIATSPDAVEELIRGGANVNARLSEGMRPLHHAVMGGKPGIVEALLRNGADVNAKDRSGWTPLHVAANNNHGELVQMLVSAGANVNAGDSSARTPLHAAASPSGREAAERLLAAGADPNARDRDGRTPLEELARTTRTLSESGYGWSDEEGEKSRALEELLRSHGAR
jgi:hypothetical protein